MDDGTIGHGFTFNPVWGCTKVSPGCDKCYAESFDKRVGGHHWGKGMPRRTFGDAHWGEPLKWNRDAQKSGVKSKVFCGSMCDVMDDEWPDGVRERLWDLIDQTPLPYMATSNQASASVQSVSAIVLRAQQCMAGNLCRESAILRCPLAHPAPDMQGLRSNVMDQLRARPGAAEHG